MKRHLYILSVGLFILSACSNEETPVTETENQAGNKELVYAYAGMPGNVPFTRLNLDPTTNIDGEDILTVTWENFGEGFSVFTGSSTTSNPFSQISIDANPHKAVFSSYISPVSGATYYAFYPIAVGTSTSVKLDMTGQDGKLNSKKVYMYDSSALNGNKLNFVFEHLTSVLEVKMDFPSVSATTEVQDMKYGGSVTPATRSVLAGKTMSNAIFSAGNLAVSGTANITVTSGNVTLTTMGDIDLGSATFTLSSSNDTPPSATVYLHLLPATLTDLTVTAKIGNSIYKGVITTGCKIEEGYFYTGSVNMKRQMSVGDLVLQSGAIIDPEIYDENGSDKAIGVLAYLFDASNKRNVTGIKTKLSKAPTGLVMALKNSPSGTGVCWRDPYDETIELKTSLKLAYEQGQDGYALTEAISKVKDFSNTTFPAAYYAKNYSVALPTNLTTTGWYLPCVGEWMDMLGKDGIGGSANYSKWKSCTDSAWCSGSDKKGVLEAINGYLKNAVTDYELFPTHSDNQWFWSSSEFSKAGAYYVNFYSEWDYVCLSRTVKNVENYSNSRVRAILAF